MRTLAVLILAASLQAATYYAAPNGSPSCDGSQACPWDLQTALNKPLAGGDVLLLGGGLYTGNFSTSLNGNGTQIIVQPQDPTFPVRINGQISTSSGGWWTLQGVEVFNATNRSMPGSDCFYLVVPSVNLIHNVIHDCGSDGVGFWSADANATAYGNLIYYNGYNQPDRGHGHGIYIQSNPGQSKLIQDNIVLNNFGWGLHSYTEGGNIDNITYRGNTVYNNSSLGTGGNGNILTGGLVVAQNPVWDSNVAYYPLTNTTPSADLGYYVGTNHANVTRNYFLGGQALYEVGSVNALISGNWIQTWSGGSKPLFRGGFQPEKKGGGGGGSTCLTGNTCGTPPLTVLVRPDLYEAGRAIITVINLGKLGSVTVPVAALGYGSGEWVTVASAEDYFGAHRTFQVINGAITLPMSGWTVAQPVGWSKPSSTLPAFGAFILRRTF